ncbi:hypothetical protein UVI_02026030 [Ustilaginoidea virens]|nr:hypothetical protein UVI_02026030 [Ustilaginoidea virens]
MKRKPSQLSLKTNPSDLIKKTALEMPASPAMAPIMQRRALKHSSSSPHMFASLNTSSFGPPGGMTFPKVLERNESGLSEVLRPMKPKPIMESEDCIAEEDSPIRTQLANRSEYEPLHESVNNEDQKSPGYPDGPIAMYGDNIYLYLEPTAEEASSFDVVINVAREVGNPFDPVGKPASSLVSAPDSPVPGTAVTSASFSTAFEYQPREDPPLETPTTPKAQPRPVPEYIHVPWDHSTDIAPDLMQLCETIESRVKNGKKVLVHCQQGASRSASLIIAYGLYQSPELSVNDAYYAAQARSRWISPNMKLMYSLQDFHKDLAKKRQSASSTQRPRIGRSPTKHRHALSADAIDMAPQEPQTAPLPGHDGLSSEMDLDSETGPGKGSAPGLPVISPGPASAPLSYSWKEDDEAAAAAAAASSSSSSSAYPAAQSSSLLPSSSSERVTWWPDSQPPPLAKLPRIASPEDLPRRPKTGFSRLQFDLRGGSNQGWPSLGLRACETPAALPDFQLPNPVKLAPEQRQNDGFPKQSVTIGSPYPEDSALLSPRVETMTNNPLHTVPKVSGLRFINSPPTPTEEPFSPREAAFSPDPFSFFGRMMGFGRPSQVADPRSPPTKGEVPIARSIDELLY